MQDSLFFKVPPRSKFPAHLRKEKTQEICVVSSVGKLV